MKKHTKTIVIDFDGVIHEYSKGWQDGSIYDNELPGAFEAIKTFQQDLGYSVVIMSTRSPWQISRWFADIEDRYYPMIGIGFKWRIIPFWKKFWNSTKYVGITNRKIAGHVYIDDRAILFEGNWPDVITTTISFKTWQKK